MTSGGLGALAASTPLERALQLADWRQIFFTLAALTVAVAIWLFCSVPEQHDRARPEPLPEQFAGVRRVFGSAHFWRFVPLGMMLTGGFMAVQSLWSISWLMQVNGYSRAVAAEHLAAMSVAMLLAYALARCAASFKTRWKRCYRMAC